jgi:hypothetical protein
LLSFHKLLAFAVTLSLLLVELVHETLAVLGFLLDDSDTGFKGLVVILSRRGNVCGGSVRVSEDLHLHVLLQGNALLHLNHV